MSAERARVAHELHDGLIQSLVGIEMETEVLRRQAAAEGSASEARFARLQDLLRGEIQSARELMRQLKSPGLDPCRVVESLSEITARFRRDTGIGASFFSDVHDIELPSRTCGEIVRVAQEALVNVRKHSGARTVAVRFTADPFHYRLEVDDDGRGFAFAGRWSHQDLDDMRRGPLVIKDRVRAIGAELVIDSKPGHGARLEVSFPRAGR